MSKRKINGWKIFAIIELIIIIIMASAGIYEFFLKKSDTAQFVGRVLSPVDGGKSIRERRQETNKPYNLTKDLKYYKSLVDKDNINVLLIGPDESGANYDTLLIASIDDKNNVVKLINLPRDIYIEYSSEVKSALKKVWPKYSSSKGIYKINAAHTIGKRINYKDGQGRFKNPEYDFTADLIEEIFGIYIDDFVYIKPSSVRRVVDYFGGVQIDVPYLMKYSDPTQNLEINIKKGLQTLNGAQAEGFVRFRQGVDEKGKHVSIGDIERKKNQVAFVKAFMDQHLNLKNIGKIITIFEDLESYVTSSIDNAKEAGDYGKVAEKLYKNKFTQVSEEIECSNTKIGDVYYLKLKVSE
ncbi:MAG: LCP family protein [Clostridiaceae bacterium]|nr:LCP family protein [Clostridiaceae bacterium]